MKKLYILTGVLIAAFCMVMLPNISAISYQEIKEVKEEYIASIFPTATGIGKILLAIIMNILVILGPTLVYIMAQGNAIVLIVGLLIWNVIGVLTEKINNIVFPNVDSIELLDGIIGLLILFIAGFTIPMYQR